MAKKINKVQEIMKRLTDANKIVILNSPADIQKNAAMNEQLEADRTEFQIKEKQSQITASQVILTA